MNGLKTNLRILWRRRGSSLAIIATLGVAIGTVTAALTVVRALTRPLAYPHSDRLMHVQAVWEGGAGTVAFVDYEALRDRCQAFTDVAAYATWRGLTLGDHTSTESADADFLTPSYLTLIGAKPLHGRLLIADDGVGEGRAVVVLGNGLWRRRFQANPDVVGTTIRVNGFPHEVVGVLAAPERGAKDLGFADGLDPQLFLPAQRLVTVVGQPPLSSGARIFWVLGLRSPDVQAAQAEAEIGGISASLQRERPDTHRGIHLRAESLNRRLQGGLQRPALALLAGAFLIFLVAVANVANLLLIRFSESRGALTLRLALGASLAQVRLMLWQQWMVLIGFGAASGIASTLLMTRALRTWIESEVAPFASVSLDGSILLAVLALLILMSGGVSLAPSLSLRTLDLRSALAIGARSIAPGRNRTRHAAVATQVAIALTVLFLAGLLVRSYSALSKAPLGFNTDRLLTFRLDLASPGLPDPASRFRFVETFLERARAVPEVEAASVWGPSMLGSASWVVMVAASAESRDAPDGLTMAFRHNVNPGGLRALGIDIVAGRDVETSDTLEAPPVGIISESLAKQMWPGDPADTVGRALVRRPPNPPILVVGVARDVRHRQRYSFADIAEADFIGGLGPQRDIYFPITQRRNDTLATFAVRLTSARSDSVRDLREIARDLNQDVAVSDVAFLDQRIAAQEAAPRAMGFLMICCAGIAAFLCILGVYAVSSYDVSLRSAEMGIRAALGASPAMLARSVIASIGWPVALGCAVGGGFSAVAARAVDSILFGIAPMDPIAFLAAALILGAGTLLALAPAARCAIRLDPALVLRN